MSFSSGSTFELAGLSSFLSSDETSSGALQYQTGNRFERRFAEKDVSHSISFEIVGCVDEDSPVFTSLGLPQQVLQSLRVVRSESTGSQRSLGGLLRSGDLLSGSDLGGGGVVLEL